MNDIQKEISRHWDALDTSPHSNNYEIVEDISIIGQLPAEIKHTICSFLPIKDLVRLAQVSCIWNVLCSEEVHWKRVFDEEKINWDSVQIWYGDPSPPPSQSLHFTPFLSLIVFSSAIQLIRHCGTNLCVLHQMSLITCPMMATLPRPSKVLYLSY